jgi:hypothetical protein
MSDKMAKLAVNIVAAINPALREIIDPAGSLHQEVREAIGTAADKVLNAFGIPGAPEVEIRTLGQTPPVDDLVQFTVGEKRCRYPEELLTAIFCYQRGWPLRRIELDVIIGFLADRCPSPSQSDGSQRREVGEYFQGLSQAIFEHQPHLLCGPEQIAAYRHDLVAAGEFEERNPIGWPPGTALLTQLIHQLLQMRLSIEDRAAVARVLQEGLNAGREPEDSAEDLIAELQPETVEIRLSRDYLREVTSAQNGSNHEEFSMLRDRLFYELAVYYPDFCVVIDNDLKPSSFQFQIGALTTVPRRGLRANQLLVDETAERLSLLNIAGEPAINPASGASSCLIDSASREAAQKAGPQVWDSIGYIALTLGAELRIASWRFVTMWMVEQHISSLAGTFPAVAEAVRKRYTTEEITRILRSLIAEEISIRDLHSIFESLLHYDYIVADASKYIIFDDRLPISTPPRDGAEKTVNLAAAVRCGLKRLITSKYTKGSNSLVVYLLDPMIEKVVSDCAIPVVTGEARTLLPEDQERILKAVHQELQTLSQDTDTVPPILTTIEVRSILRALLTDEFPSLPVIAYQELSSDANIQPIARITLSDVLDH